MQFRARHEKDLGKSFPHKELYIHTKRRCVKTCILGIWEHGFSKSGGSIPCLAREGSSRGHVQQGGGSGLHDGEGDAGGVGGEQQVAGGVEGDGGAGGDVGADDEGLGGDDALGEEDGGDAQEERDQDDGH